MIYLILGIVLALGLGTLFGLRLQLAKQRARSLLRTLDAQRHATSSEAGLVATLRMREHFKARKGWEHVRVVNAAQFLLIWNWDLSMILDLLDPKEEEDWSVAEEYRRKLAARWLALNAVEGLDKLKN